MGLTDPGKLVPASDLAIAHRRKGPKRATRGEGWWSRPAIALQVHSSLVRPHSTLWSVSFGSPFRLRLQSASGARQPGAALLQSCDCSLLQVNQS